MRLGLLAILLLVGCSRLYTGPSSVDNTPDYVSDAEAQRFNEGCRENLRHSHGAKTLHSRVIEDGPYRWATIPYTIEGNDRGVHVVASVTLDLGQLPAEHQAHYWGRFQNIRHCVQSFYQRYDVFLNLTFYRSGEQGAVSPQSPGYVTVRRSGMRVSTFNMNNWAFEMDGVPLTDEVACTVVSHEIGHMLGLRDEYYDYSVTNRRIGEEDSVMKRCQVTPGQARFYPHHIRTIIKNACETPHADLPYIHGGEHYVLPY